MDKAVLNVLVASTLMDVPIVILPGKLFNDSTPLFDILIVENRNPPAAFVVARFITPLLIFKAPIGDVCVPELLILVVVIVWVQVPPFIFMIAAPELPWISFPGPTKKLPAVNMNDPNLRLDEVDKVPDDLLTSIFRKTELRDKFVKPCAPVPEKTILAPAGHAPKQLWPVENKAILPFTFKIQVAVEKAILLVSAAFILRSLHTALALSTVMVCPVCTKTPVVAVGIWPAVAAIHVLPLKTFHALKSLQFPAAFFV